MIAVGWLCLMLMMPVAIAKEPLVVYLNHVFLTLDEETYEAIAASPFLQNEFASLRQTTVADGNKSWSGMYVFGEQTYIEMFKGDAERRPGQSAVAFGVESESQMQAIQKRLTVLHQDRALFTLRTRKQGEGQIPWFYSAAIGERDPTAMLSSWVMQYHPDHLKLRYPDSPPEEQGISRKAYLKRIFDARKYFKEVVEVVIAVGVTERQRFLDLATALDYRIRKQGEDTLCEGLHIRFRLTPAKPSFEGIVAVTISLLREKTGQKRYPISPRSTLEFTGNRKAVWRFQ